MKFLEIDWNWILLPITFLMSLSSVFNRMIGLNIFGELQEVLLGLGIIMEDDILKCNSQWPKLMYVLVMLIKFFKHVLLLMMALRCFQDNLSGPEVDELLHFEIKLLNSSSENAIHIITDLLRLSSNKSRLIWWLWAELNNECRDFQRLSSSRHSQPMYWIASMSSNLCFLCCRLKTLELVMRINLVPGWYKRTR